MIVEALESLSLDDVALVGNDTGGALCQMVVTTTPERVGRLVLTSCDYRDNLPPRLRCACARAAPLADCPRVAREAADRCRRRGLLRSRRPSAALLWVAWG